MSSFYGAGGSNSDSIDERINNAVNGLDAADVATAVVDATDSTKVGIYAVKEENGVISQGAKIIDVDAAGTAAQVKTALEGGDADTAESKTIAGAKKYADSLIEESLVDLSNYVTTSDSRLSNARPASDVYAWAKAAEKPSYSASEISGLGSLATKNSLSAGDVGAVSKSGDTMTGNLTAPSFQTGIKDANYFQCRKFRGEGDADNYYHAVDFGYEGHNQVDFYEYGGKYVFHRHNLQPEKSIGDTVIGEINSNGFVGKVNGHKINADVPAGAKFTDTTYSDATTSVAGLMSPTDKAKLDGIDPSVITTNAANIKKNADEIATYIAGQRNPDLLGKGAYIGRKIEGGGTIFFDYAIGFRGGVYVAPITENLHSYHVDPLTGVVMCDDPEDTTKQDRFMVVSDYDIGDYKHGNNLTWSNGTSGSLYTAIGTATEFGTGKANTEKCIAAATTDGLIGWNTNAYNCIWHYVSGGDWRRTTDRGTHVWFVPSKDELTVLLYMQWSIASKRKSYDGKTQLIQLPINFYSNYWSSSEDGAMMVFQAYFCGGAMDTIDKSYAGGILVRLVRTF